MNIKVRQANTADLKRISEIDEKCFSKPWGISTFEADLDDEMKALWVAEADGKIAGYLDAFVLATCDGEVLRIATDPEFRRNKVAHNLLNFMLCYLNLNASPRIILEVRADNEAAIALYKSFGFNEDGIRPKYYDNSVDAVLMSRVVSIDTRVLQLDIEDGLYDK